mmetsp:Transcript_37024/g.72818  ORF Transcript_37024/g.72818 Transcript_37024/m.72818 type:complete len:100 (+) Transcript_37024:1268-1567(+)
MASSLNILSAASSPQFSLKEKETGTSFGFLIRSAHMLARSVSLLADSFVKHPAFLFIKGASASSSQKESSRIILPCSLTQWEGILATLQLRIDYTSKLI